MSTLKVNTIADPDNGNTAITIDSSGNATFAQNLSITGNLTGDGSALTGISSPSNILQVVSGSWNGESSTINPSENTWYDSGWTIYFTPESATSKFILYAHTRLSVKKTTSSAFHGASMRFKKTQSSTVTYPSQLGGSMDGNLHHQLTDLFGTTMDPHSIPVTFFAIEESSSTDQISYLMQYGGYGLSSNAKLWAGSQWSFPTSYQIIEFEE